MTEVTKIPRIIIKEYSTFICSDDPTSYTVDYEFRLYKDLNLADNTIHRTSERSTFF